MKARWFVPNRAASCAASLVFVTLLTIPASADAQQPSARSGTDVVEASEPGETATQTSAVGQEGTATPVAPRYQRQQRQRAAALIIVGALTIGAGIGTALVIGLPDDSNDDGDDYSTSFQDGINMAIGDGIVIGILGALAAGGLVMLIAGAVRLHRSRRLESELVAQRRRSTLLRLALGQPVRF